MKQAAQKLVPYPARQYRNSATAAETEEANKEYGRF